MAALPVFQLCRSVRRPGYTVDELTSRPSTGPECWQVNATRDGRVIRAWAPTRASTWVLDGADGGERGATEKEGVAVEV